MKTFKTFIAEMWGSVYEDITLDSGWANMKKSVNDIDLPSDAVSLGKIKVDGDTYHFHRYHNPKAMPAYGEDPEHQGFVTKLNDEGKHKVVGYARFDLVDNTDELDSDDEHNDPTVTADTPVLNSDHRGKGLMSELYKRWSNDSGHNIISGRGQSPGGKHIWDELALSGRVHMMDFSGRREHRGRYDIRDDNHQHIVYGDHGRPDSDYRLLYKPERT